MRLNQTSYTHPEDDADEQSRQWKSGHVMGM